MQFTFLLDHIKDTHRHLYDTAVKAINKLLTIRNWLIGFYIVEYEQKGEDRAQYGEKLLYTLAKELTSEKISFRHLQLCRQFYLVYPQIRQSLTDLLGDSHISQSVIAQLHLANNGNSPIRQSVTAESKGTSLQISSDKLINKLSFTHLVQLFPITDPLQRTFYEAGIKPLVHNSR